MLSLFALRRVYLDFILVGTTFSQANAASVGVKPTESQGLFGLFVAANYRPAGMNPAVAKTRSKMPHSVA